MTLQKKCPNCRKELQFVLGEWICPECEYHAKKPKKQVKGSFR